MGDGSMHAPTNSCSRLLTVAADPGVGSYQVITRRKHMNRFFMVVLVAMFLAGCAASGRIGELPKIDNLAAGGKVVVVRTSSFVGAANTYTVALDGGIFSISVLGSTLTF